MDKNKAFGYFKTRLASFALAFFSNRHARGRAKYGVGGFLIAAVISYVLLCGGLTVGYNTSFSKHYADAEGFKSFLSGASAKVALTCESNRLSAQTEGERIETFSEENEYLRVNGYHFIVDTRPAGETFDDFTIVCKSSDGGEITYGEYRQLSAEDAQKYTLSVKYSGETLDTAAKQGIYRAYLDKVSKEGEKEYNADIAAKYKRLTDGGQEGYSVYDEIYKLYAQAYYPDFAEIEKYSSVPTVRTYYLNKLASEKTDKYLVIFDEYLLCSFVTDGGVGVGFSGVYEFADGRIGFDELILSTFEGNSGMNFLVFLSDMILSAAVFALFLIIISSVCAVPLVKRGAEYKNYSGMLYAFGSFLPFCAILCFFTGIALPYFLNIGGAYLAVRIIFASLVTARIAVLLGFDIAAAKKTAATLGAARPVPEPEPEPADPFSEGVKVTNASDGGQPPENTGYSGRFSDITIEPPENGEPDAEPQGGEDEIRTPDENI